VVTPTQPRSICMEIVNTHTAGSIHQTWLTHHTYPALRRLVFYCFYSKNLACHLSQHPNSHNCNPKSEQCKLPPKIPHPIPHVLWPNYPGETIVPSTLPCDHLQAVQRHQDRHSHHPNTYRRTARYTSSMQDRIKQTLPQYVPKLWSTVEPTNQ